MSTLPTGSGVTEAYLGSIPIYDVRMSNVPSKLKAGIDDAKKIANVDYLVVGGGGAGGFELAGGGGGGGVVSGSIPVLFNNLTVIVGDGGTAGTEGNGKPSYLIGSGINVEAIGGGRGGSNAQAGFDGGSGGGGGGFGGAYDGGSGTVGQGNDGGKGGGTQPVSFAGGGGGGGGASQPGTDGAARGDGGDGGVGGAGSQWLNGLYYGGGGGGGGDANASPTPDGAAGGIGGGGTGGNSFDSPTATEGTDGLGGGGGGNFVGKDGGSGTVIIRYSGVPTASGGSITQSGGYTYHTFTNVATSSFNLYT